MFRSTDCSNSLADAVTGSNDCCVVKNNNNENKNVLFLSVIVLSSFLCSLAKATFILCHKFYWNQMQNKGKLHLEAKCIDIVFVNQSL